MRLFWLAVASLDHLLTFEEQLRYASKKSGKTVVALTGMMSNIGGANPPRRLLLARVCSYILLYAAPVWTNTLNIQAYKRKLSSAYCLSALRVASAMRTTSDEAAFLVAQMVPIAKIMQLESTQ
ncbi:uncharacterized protein LOC119648585 [Hermetia illucens]|uniref:uncharacterized protein LOC119648585 n=1 Tax=Hermetia illucens TaxID=343691 RepID=UPI0018CC630A|nr:uncharacterized protein LOC119648585 [Hermetia illucens]